MAEIDVACENCGEEWENTSDGYLCCQKKIAKLEKQLEESQKYTPVLRSELNHANKLVERAEKREAKLREALEFYAKYSLNVAYAKDCGAKARAALEVSDE